MKHVDYSSYLTMSPLELRHLQRRKGWAMSFIGKVVCFVLKLFKQTAKDYKGICPYFEIGNGWGGASFGWFFICSKDCSERSRNHEVGHCIQNAAVGGLKMAAYSGASAFRYWFIKIFRLKTDYDSWYFEGDATRIGNEYVKNMEINANN